MSSKCESVATRIAASSLHCGAKQLTASSIREQTSRFRFPMSTTSTKKQPEPRRATQSQLSNFFVESQYLQSICQRRCCYAFWKSGFSQTNRLLWTETLKLAVRDLLAEEAGPGCDHFIDDAGVHRYAELVEWAIFEYQAADPAEYGNKMAAKYDAIRAGDFSKEESRLLHHYAWL